MPWGCHLAAMSLSLSWCAGPAALSGFVQVPVVEAPARLPPAAVWLALARRALAAGSHEEALRCFDNALVHEPDLALAQLGRAACLAQLERDDEAAAATERLMGMTRGQEDVLYQLARMCAREGRVSVGVALLTEAVRAQPGLEAQAASDALFADHPAYLQALGRL